MWKGGVEGVEGNAEVGEGAEFGPRSIELAEKIEIQILKN